MLEKGPKQRSNIGSDKLKWDGDPSTHDPFSKDLKGSITKLGMGYLLNTEVQELYMELGIAMADDVNFYHKWNISKKQFQHDVTHLYGILQSSTKDFDCGHVLAHRKTQDGLLAYLEMEAENQYDGSKTLKEEELDENIKEPYDERKWSNLVSYVARFKTWVHQLSALEASSMDDREKKKQLLRNLQTDHDLSGLIQTCKDNTSWGFHKSAHHLTTNRLPLKRNLAKSGRRGVNTTTLDLGPPEEDPHSRAMNTIQDLVDEQGLIKAYNTMQSTTVRNSLSVPDLIWDKLEPDMRKKILEIKKELREKKQTASPVPKPATVTSKPNLPAQHPTMSANQTSQLDEFLAKINNLTIEDAGDDSTDDEAMVLGLHMARTSHDPPGVSDDSYEPIELKAHLEYESRFSDKRSYAISDGGADSTVLGADAYIESFTGKHAYLTGYDPETTRSDKIPIGTGYVKAKSNTNIPVILKFNQAAINSRSKVTLIFEYQAREHGYVCDSVSSKHNINLKGDKGTQRLVLNEDVWIPFVDRGGIMGFEMLPIEKGDLDEVDPVFDIFEMTSDSKWIPARYRSEVMKAHVEEEETIPPSDDIDFLDDPCVPECQPAFINHSTKSLDDLLDLFSYAQLVNQDTFCPEDHDLPSLPPEDHDYEGLFHPEMRQACLATTPRPWQRTHYPRVDPKTLRRFFAWRPTEIIVKTLECTTQLAKSFLKHPMRRHCKARNPFSNVIRINQTVSTDPHFANVPSLFHIWLASQTFYGLKSHHIDVHGMKGKGEFINTYRDFIRDQGAPSTLRRDNAKEEASPDVVDLQRKFMIKDQWSEPFPPPPEPCGIRCNQMVKVPDSCPP